MSAFQNNIEQFNVPMSNQNVPVEYSSSSLNDCLPTVTYVHSKIMEFSNLLNGSYRISLLNCKPSERQTLLYALISLKKNIKWALEELGNSLRNREYKFNCGLCDEEIIINPNEDIWSSLQNHEHFEVLYYQFLNNQLEISPVDTPIALESESSIIIEDNTTAGDSNTDSGIEQHEMEPSTSGICKISSISAKSHHADENVNSFRFNFDINYDECIENNLYPSSTMLGVRKYDKVKEYTVMRAGNTKAACLICPCEMNGMRISKHMLVNHAMGQKHLKAATHHPTLEVLKFYHDFWLKQDTPIQAHQVYFRSNQMSNMHCIMCCTTLHVMEVISHIMNNVHKRKVLEMYEKRINLYMLINLQVQVYGLTQEQVEARENEYKLKEEAEKEKKPRKNSDSDTPDEAKKLVKSQSINHNIIKSVENTESSNPLDHLPNRMKDDTTFFKLITSSNSTVVRCDLCKCDLQVNVEALKQHILTSTFHQFRKKGNYMYYCEICNTKVNNENSWMNHNFSGPRHTNVAASRKERIMEYECTTCKTVIFGDDISLNRHLAIGAKRNKRDRGTQLPDSVKKLFNSRDHILAKAAALAGEAENVLANSLTEDCCGRLELALSEIFEVCKVYPFGSRISGIGNKDSDLDVFVDIGGTYFGERNQDPTDQVLVIRKTYKVLIKNKEFANIVQVLTARTPILKLHHVPTKLDCDLSFKHGLSVENTKFLRFCIELQPVCQQLTLLIKKWAEQIGFECITTYALAILCIFYLQVNGYLLSVKTLGDINNVEIQSINGWKTINYVLPVDEAKSHIKAYENTLFELLQEFFKFYSKFDFNSYVVCPLLGRVVKRSLFSEGSPEDLPPEMETYAAQLEGDDPELFRSNSFMCIQDPFDLSHNLTKAAQQGTLTKFQTMCKLSLLHIEALK